MDTQKMIARVEKLKVEVASMQKEVKAEVKRAKKLEDAANKTLRKLRDKLAAMTPAERGEADKEPTAKAEKLRKEIDDLQEKIYSMEDGNALGMEGDNGADESIVGAFDSLTFALDELVSGKGKKRNGLLPTYEEQLANDA